MRVLSSAEQGFVPVGSYGPVRLTGPTGPIARRAHSSYGRVRAYAGSGWCQRHLKKRTFYGRSQDWQQSPFLYYRPMQNRLILFVLTVGEQPLVLRASERFA